MLDGDAAVSGTGEGAGQNILGEHRNVRACAAMVLALKIEFFGREGLNELVKALRVCALEVVDALRRIAERDESGVLTEAADHSPFIGVGVLELVDDDQRIRGRVR